MYWGPVQLCHQPRRPPISAIVSDQTAGATILCSAHYSFHLFSANVAEISHLHLDFNLCLIALMEIGKNMKFLKIDQLDLRGF